MSLMGHSRPINSAQVPTNVRSYPKSAKWCVAANDAKCQAAIAAPHLITSSARVASALLRFYHLAQLLAQFRAIVMTMHRHGVLHRSVYKLLLSVGRNRNRAVHLAWIIAAIDRHSGHKSLLWHNMINLSHFAHSRNAITDPKWLGLDVVAGYECNIRLAPFTSFRRYAGYVCLCFDSGGKAETAILRMSAEAEPSNEVHRTNCRPICFV
jgi:hypothetical protein